MFQATADQLKQIQKEACLFIDGERAQEKLF